VIDYDAPATSTQIRTIAKLCSGLRIQEPLEEKYKTFGSAGKLVRQLSTQLNYEKKKGIKRCPKCGQVLLSNFGSGYCPVHGTIIGRSKR